MKKPYPTIITDNILKELSHVSGETIQQDIFDSRGKSASLGVFNP